jgi:hypothetical protein
MCHQPQVEGTNLNVERCYRSASEAIRIPAALCGVYGYKPPFADEVVFRVAYHHAKRSAVDLHTRTFPTLQV